MSIWGITGMLTSLGEILQAPEWLEPFMEFIPGYKIKITLGAFFCLGITLTVLMLDPFAMPVLATGNTKFLLISPALSMINFLCFLGYRPVFYQEVKDEITTRLMERNPPNKCD
ncbi:hypothetical protein BB561_001079 [Smittium simulii]|uniref:Uncharacterized protein n=1 Tax=Smittium simulii TaxID=133385 RepID=A0A2T9YW98_9FUNG|nr:hypothetical protein BB561_001079 [Smittium simulii]